MKENCCSPGKNEEGLTGWEVEERRILQEKVKECGKNLTYLSRHLGLTIPTVRKRLRKYGLWDNKVNQHEKSA